MNPPSEKPVEVANGQPTPEKPIERPSWVKTIPKKRAPEKVVVHGYPPIIFIWPLIALGFLFCPLSAWGWLSPKAEAWIYASMLVVVVLTIGLDLGRNTTIFWAVLIALIWVGILYLRDVGHIMVFSDIAKWIRGLHPEWSPDFGLVSSIMLSIVYLIIVVKAWLNDRWVFRNNEIEHWAFGRNDDSMGRGAKVVSTTYPDILEMILLAAGTVTIYNAQRTRVLATIRGVPFLPFRVGKINRVLESVAVTNADEETEHEEHEGGEIENDDTGLTG